MKKRGWGVVIYGMTIVAVLLAAQWGSRAATVIAERTPIERNATIIIDAGHGGMDGGAISCTGLSESGYNLNISLRLNDLFHLMGYDTAMIRTKDVSVNTKGETIAQKKISDLKERVRLVNETENGLLVSIHQNFFPDQQYSGTQVFYTETEGSEELAKALQDAFITSVNPRSRRRIKKSQGVYLMEHIQRPGVLIECGFLSNPEEEAKLRSETYQKKLCCIIAATVGNFLANA